MPNPGSGFCVLVLPSALGPEMQPRKNNEVCSRRFYSLYVCLLLELLVPSQNTVPRSYLGGHCSLFSFSVSRIHVIISSKPAMASLEESSLAVLALLCVYLSAFSLQITMTNTDNLTPFTVPPSLHRLYVHKTTTKENNV